MRLIVALISSALVAAPAFAQTAGGVMGGSGAGLTEHPGPSENNADAGEPGTAPNGERLICRRINTTTGSRLRTRKVCRTAQQWRAEQRAS